MLWNPPPTGRSASNNLASTQGLLTIFEQFLKTPPRRVYLAGVARERAHVQRGKSVTGGGHVRDAACRGHETDMKRTLS